MAQEGLRPESPAPVLVLVDDDREASQKIALLPSGDWFFVPVIHPAQAVRYTKQFRPTVVLLAEPVDFPRGRAARFLQELLDEAERPVIILTEDPSAKSTG